MTEKHDERVSSGRMKSTLWAWLVASFVIAGLLIALRPSRRLSPSEQGSPSSTVEQASNAGQESSKSPFSESEERVGNEQEVIQERPQVDVNDFAVPVEGNPLLVTLAYRPEFGQISIERYDSKGEPTGQPLKSGTMVHIPDPDNPGERIRFTTP